MNSTKKTGRIVGLLFLFIFFIGIVSYQVIQGPILFSKDFLTITITNKTSIILSVLLLLISGIFSVLAAIQLLPIFKKHTTRLAFLYLAFCILSAVAIVIDNTNVLALLEISSEASKNDFSSTLNTLGAVAYKNHWWTHYMSLLISCFPVFVLYYILFITKLVPKLISTFGMLAVLLMFTEFTASLFGNSISMNLLLPIGLVQLFLPIWLLIKGFKETSIT